MKWEPTLPCRGDIIRIKYKFYYHFGIYIDDSTVVQFGLPEDSVRPAEEVRVLISDIEAFSCGGEVECAVLSAVEKARRRPADDTCAFALSKVGEGGYNILHNNCEHFVHLCVFGKKSSPEMDLVRKEIRKKLKKDMKKS